MAVLRRSPPFRAHQAMALFGLSLVAVALFWALPARADFRSVLIVDNAFQPDNLVVQLGDTVVWQHNGERPHGVRSDAGLWDSSPGCSFSNPGPCMKKGDTFSVTFQRAGTFFYHCPVHGASGGGSAMNGQVTVASSSGGTSATTTTTRPATTTTARPTTTAAPTTTQPGATTTAPPGATTTLTSGVAPTVTSAPGGTVTTAVATTLLVSPTTVPPLGGGSDRTTLVIIGLVVLAAALAAGAWYFRPGRPSV